MITPLIASVLVWAAKNKPKPSETPTPEPDSGAGNADTGSGDTGTGDTGGDDGSATSGIIDWLIAHPWPIIAIVAIIGVFYGWKQLQLYYRERGKIIPPLGYIIRRGVRFALVEDTGPVIKRIPQLKWFKWRMVYPLIAIAAIVLYTQGRHDLLLAVALITLIIWWRARKIFRIRNGILMQMFNVAASEFRYPKEAALNPWGYINITKWVDMYRPGQTIITFPPGFQSEDLNARERFERNFSGSVSDENSFTYEWKSAQNRVIASPTPYLPATAKYPGHDEHPWNEFPLGITWGGKEAILDISVTPHCLVAGPTGSGKSVLQRTILLHALQSPDWRVIGIDPKMVELGPYKDHENVLKIATQLEESAALLESAETEMKRRYEEMTQYGVNHFKDLPPDPETGRPHPALLIMVDETYALLAPEGIKSDEGKERDALHARCTVLIGSIARLGRAAGVHLVLATQRPDAKVLPGETRNNLDARIACGRMDTTPSLMVLDSDHATRLPLIKGRSVLRLGGEVKEYQGYFLPIEDVDAVVRRGLERNRQRAAGVAVAALPDADVEADASLGGVGVGFGFPGGGNAAAGPSAPAPASGGGLKGWWARRQAAASEFDSQWGGQEPAAGGKPGRRNKAAAGAAGVVSSDPLVHEIETATWSGSGSGWDPLDSDVSEGWGPDDINGVSVEDFSNASGPDAWGSMGVPATNPFASGNGGRGYTSEEFAQDFHIGESQGAGSVAGFENGFGDPADFTDVESAAPVDLSIEDIIAQYSDPVLTSEPVIDTGVVAGSPEFSGEGVDDWVSPPAPLPVPEVFTFADVESVPPVGEAPEEYPESVPEAVVVPVVLPVQPPAAPVQPVQKSAPAPQAEPTNGPVRREPPAPVEQTVQRPAPAKKQFPPAPSSPAVQPSPQTPVPAQAGRQLPPKPAPKPAGKPAPAAQPPAPPARRLPPRPPKPPAS